MDNRTTSLAERIAMLVGDNISAFSRRSGISDSLLRQYISGSKPGLDKAAAIAQTANVDLQWLATGASTSVRELVSEPSSASYQPEPHSIFQPIKSFLPNERKHTSNHTHPSSSHLAFSSDWLSLQGFSEEQLMLLEAIGDSMAPTIEEGNAVVINTQDCHPSDGCLYLLEFQDFNLIRRVHMQPGTGIKLISDNTQYDDVAVTTMDIDQQITFVGRVIWIGKTC